MKGKEKTAFGHCCNSGGSCLLLCGAAGGKHSFFRDVVLYDCTGDCNCASLYEERTDWNSGIETEQDDEESRCCSSGTWNYLSGRYALSSPIINAKKYQKLMKVEERTLQKILRNSL